MSYLTGFAYKIVEIILGEKVQNIGDQHQFYFFQGQPLRTLYIGKTTFGAPEERDFENIVKKEKIHFLVFSQCFLPYEKEVKFF